MIPALALVVAVLVGTSPPVDPGQPGPPSPPPAPAPRSGSSPSAASQRAASARAVPLAPEHGAVVRVRDSETLVSALTAVLPGQTIELADGTYRGAFAIDRAGTEAAPITLRGSARAILDGGDRATVDAALRLIGASHWQLVGFAVTGARNGIELARTDHTVLSGLDVGRSGRDGVRVAGRSSRNVVQNCLIHDSGSVGPSGGVGLRIGGGPADQPALRAGQPDRSDGTKVINNTFRRTTGPNLEVHQATEGGLIVGNLFDGSRVRTSAGGGFVLELSGAGYRIVDNVTSGAVGFRARVVGNPAVSGCGNTFRNNFFAFTGVTTIVLDPRCPARK